MTGLSGPSDMTGLITLDGLGRERLTELLDKAEAYVESEPSDVLAGATVTTAFFEASTRTRLSFERAAQSCMPSVARMLAVLREIGALPTRVSTGTPIHSESMVVVAPL